MWSHAESRRWRTGCGRGCTGERGGAEDDTGQDEGPHVGCEFSRTNALALYDALEKPASSDGERCPCSNTASNSTAWLVR